MATLSAQQQQAASMIDAAIKARGEAFVLHGLAGTGKTTTLGHIARSNPDAISLHAHRQGGLGTKQGKVSRRPGADDPFGVLQADRQSARRERPQQLYWKEKNGQASMRHRTVLIDECSMVDDRMAEDIIAPAQRSWHAATRASFRPCVGASSSTGQTSCSPKSTGRRRSGPSSGRRIACARRANTQRTATTSAYRKRHGRRYPQRRCNPVLDE